MVTAVVQRRWRYGDEAGARRSKKIDITRWLGRGGVAGGCAVPARARGIVNLFDAGINRGDVLILVGAASYALYNIPTAAGRRRSGRVNL